jgi:predicted amidohydrolase YtcJ
MKLGRYPTKEDIDVIVPDRPVFLYRNCHHIAVVNSKGLQELKIDSNTPQPTGGSIDITTG